MVSDLTANIYRFSKITYITPNKKKKKNLYFPACKQAIKKKKTNHKPNQNATQQIKRQSSELDFALFVRCLSCATTCTK